MAKRSREFFAYGLQTDRIRYIHEFDEAGNIKKINVFYETLINDNWICIVRYDNFHGYLHRHFRITLESKSTIVDTDVIIKKGNPAEWLTWAISDILRNFLEYKRDFLSTNKIDGY